MTEADPSAATLQLGSVAIPQRVGKYVVERVLGHGGMATVYFAREEGTGRPVALKVLAPNFAGNAKMLERFRHEAELMAALKHRNVVGVLGWGASSGQAWIATEFVDGGTVRELKDSTGPMAPPLAGELVAQMLSGLAAAHERTVVHRDLKPENLFLGREGVLKVGDFGIARAVDQTHLTGTGMLVGTAQYMSPEQAQGHEVDERSDLFTTGIIFYELLAGTNPFEADVAMTSLARVTECTQPPLTELAPAAPPAVEAFVEKLLSQDRERRHPNAQAALTELEALLGPREPTLLTDCLARPTEVAQRLRAAQAEVLFAEARGLSQGELQARTLAAVRLRAALALDPGRVEAHRLLQELARADGLDFGEARNPRILDLERLVAERPAPALLLQLAQLYKLEGNPVMSLRYLKRCLRLKPGDAYVAGLVTQLTGERPVLVVGGRPVAVSGDVASGIRTGGLRAMQREAPVGGEVGTPLRPKAAEPDGLTMRPSYGGEAPVVSLLKRVGGVVALIALVALGVRALSRFVDSSTADAARAERELRRGGLAPPEPEPPPRPVVGPLVRPVRPHVEDEPLASDAAAKAKLEAALTLRADDDIEGALAELTAVVEGFPHALEKGDALLALAKLREDQALFSAARAAAGRLVTELPDHPRLPEALLTRGKLNERLLARDAAERDFRRLTVDFANSPQCAEAHLRWGLSLVGAERLDDAREHLRRAVELSAAGDAVRAEAQAALEKLK